MKPARSLIAFLAVVVLAVAVSLALRGGGDTAKDAGASLRPLALGEPGLLPLSGVAERVGTEKLLGRGEIVFIGRVTDVGGSEGVTPAGAAGEPFVLTRHRVRFAVQRVLRGTDAETIDISLLDLPDANYAFEVGKPYLVFARRTELGTLRTPAIVPDGYGQGVFALGAGGTASNPINGTVTIDDVEARLR